ncbi:tryptophan synthase subunit alpha [Blochmannia endosymbiont of Colobopsis nipponica]|uniref:tryptophan synthase subunit alpha n=1 Tax=Blochmannia endosymbiont of Colobopsis nipponica TaxID=2681987 RepID=UPI001786A890|nr:tryptophan synthase subunit alpha [Blochmannia endosymbiont of Colobopsis nipponica]QOI11026.1 tryptophan synthase subunit alpha [Blochmannia endosymbiont of Colobopsis nipponica]
MNRYQKMFSNLSKCNEKAFVPFLTIGDPNPNLFLDIINSIIEAGADALELGIPFSDPLADGPIIQKSMQRTLLIGITLNECFNLVSKIRQKYPKIPIGILTYANLVFKNNINTFYSRCISVGIDSILIADLPLEESSEFYEAAIKNNIKQVFICPPNANENLLKKISKFSQAYIYLLSRSGVTGITNTNSVSLTEIIKRLKKQQNDIPILQGFGISHPEQVRKILQNPKISGVISGSAIIKIIEQNLHNSVQLITHITQFVKKMKLATYLNK